MHSCIERRCRNESVYTVDEWCELIKDAKVKKPYIVSKMQQNEFLDFLALAEHQNWHLIQISELQEIMFNPITQMVYVKYDFHEDFQAIDVNKSSVNWRQHILEPAHAK